VNCTLSAISCAHNIIFVLFDINDFIINFKIYLLRKLLLLFTLATLFTSCDNDPAVDLSSIDGNWELVSAKRNGNLTNTLDKSFFNFADGTFTHNINGDTVQTKYSIDGNEILLEDELLKKFKVKSNIKDTLNLETKIGGMKFEFEMKRKNE
jgi:hypothetical protein